MARFYQKWFLDMEDARNHQTGYVPHTVPFGGGGGGPAWGSAYVIMPWAYYQYYGDKKVLQTHYEGMKKWVEYLGTRCNINGIVVREEPRGWCLGDWATPEKIKLSPELVNSCYYFYVTDLMSKVAAELGNLTDKNEFEKLAISIKNNINRKFYNKKASCYLDGKQGANLFPMAFGIAEVSERPQIFATIINQLEQLKYHFDTGILATPLLLRVLTENGRADLAYLVMNQKDFPGFGDYIIGKKATTLWENWNGASSHSHPMYGSVIAWFFNTLAGISPDPSLPGKPDFVIDPSVDNELTYAKAAYHSIYGLRYCSWKKESGSILMDVEIPVNTNAIIHFPCSKAEQIQENGIPILKSGNFKYLGTAKGKEVFQVGSGKYLFKLLLQN
jgi:alpha-L-rhamnosidase